MENPSLTIRMRCPQCNVKIQRELKHPLPNSWECGRCSNQIKLENQEFKKDLPHCIVCDYPYFFVEKDFPRPLAFFIMGIGILLSFFTYGISLIVCGLIDWALYKILPFFRVCYYCKAEYRGFPEKNDLELFDPHKGVAYDARRNQSTS